MKSVKSLLYVIICLILLWCLAWIIMFTMDYLREIESLVWYIIAIPISFFILFIINNILLKLITALSRLNTKSIIANIAITVGFYFSVTQIYFLWKESDLSYIRQIIIATYGTLSLISGFGRILYLMNKTLLLNKLAEKKINLIYNARKTLQ